MKCLFLPVIFAMLLTACTKTIYVPVENSTASFVNSTAVSSRIDTILKSDTVIITLSEKGDTVNNIITRWRTRITTEHDTVSVERTDTVIRQIPVPIETTSSRYKVKNYIVGFISIAFLALCIFYGILLYLKRNFGKS